MVVEDVVLAVGQFAMFAIWGLQTLAVAAYMLGYRIQQKETSSDIPKVPPAEEAPTTMGKAWDLRPMRIARNGRGKDLLVLNWKRPLQAEPKSYVVEYSADGFIWNPLSTVYVTCCVVFSSDTPFSYRVTAVGETARSEPEIINDVRVTNLMEYDEALATPPPLDHHNLPFQTDELFGPIASSAL
ncbi:hypothetical protein ScPMuIL_002479 [Solemya velum]